MLALAHLILIAGHHEHQGCLQIELSFVVASQLHRRHSNTRLTSHHHTITPSHHTITPSPHHPSNTPKCPSPFHSRCPHNASDALPPPSTHLPSLASAVRTCDIPHGDDAPIGCHRDYYASLSGSDAEGQHHHGYEDCTRKRYRNLVATEYHYSFTCRSCVGHMSVTCRSHVSHMQ